MEATGTNERGAQLSQECPPPVNLPSGTKVRTAQCRWCGRLFRMGRVWVDSGAAGETVSRQPAAGWRTTANPDRKRAIRIADVSKMKKPAPSLGG